jgi:hypothetical protein
MAARSSGGGGGSSSDSDSDSELWASDEDKENAADRTAVGRGRRRHPGGAADQPPKASPSVAALTARSAATAEGLARQRQKHDRLLRAHQQQGEELQAAREELQQLRFSQPRLQRELEVAHDTTRKTVDARRNDKAELQQRLLAAEEAADAMSAQCGADVRALAQRLQEFAATPAAGTPLAAQLLRDASRHTASIASHLGHDDVASELRHLCPAAGQTASSRVDPASVSAPWSPASRYTEAAPRSRSDSVGGGGSDSVGSGRQHTTGKRDKAEFVALEQAELIQAYRVALLKERKRSAQLQRSAAAAKAERDQLRESLGTDGTAAAQGTAEEESRRPKELERTEPFLAEVETLKQLAAEATAQAQEALEAAKHPPQRANNSSEQRSRSQQQQQPSQGGKEQAAGSSKEETMAEADSDAMARVLARASGSPIHARKTDRKQVRGEAAASSPASANAAGTHSVSGADVVSGSGGGADSRRERLESSETVRAWHDRLMQSERVILTQQERVEELEELVADQKRDLQAALGMVIRRATPSPPQPPQPLPPPAAAGNHGHVYAHADYSGAELPPPESLVSQAAHSQQLQGCAYEPPNAVRLFQTPGGIPIAAASAVGATPTASAAKWAADVGINLG